MYAKLFLQCLRKGLSRNIKQSTYKIRSIILLINIHLTYFFVKKIQSNTAVAYFQDGVRLIFDNYSVRVIRLKSTITFLIWLNDQRLN